MGQLAAIERDPGPLVYLALEPADYLGVGRTLRVGVDRRYIVRLLRARDTAGGSGIRADEAPASEPMTTGYAAGSTSISADTLINAAMALAILSEPEAGLALASTAIRLNPYHSDWYFSYLGGCHFIAGHFVDTIAAMEKAPDALPEVRAILAAAYAQVGRLDEARTEIAEFVRRFPSHWTGHPSIQFFAGTFHWGRKESINRLLEGLRKAGLPE